MRSRSGRIAPAWRGASPEGERSAALALRAVHRLPGRGSPRRSGRFCLMS